MKLEAKVGDHSYWMYQDDWEKQKEWVENAIKSFPRLNLKT